MLEVVKPAAVVRSAVSARERPLPVHVPVLPFAVVHGTAAARRETSVFGQNTAKQGEDRLRTLASGRCPARASDRPSIPLRTPLRQPTGTHPARSAASRIRAGRQKELSICADRNVFDVRRGCGVIYYHGSRSECPLKDVSILEDARGGAADSDGGKMLSVETHERALEKETRPPSSRVHAPRSVAHLSPRMRSCLNDERGQEQACVISTFLLLTA